MKKLFLISFLLCSSLFAVATETNWTFERRPKVAVVLSGGGAKGVAHVRALKVIEEAGIPVDMVVGTSMGSIIGGLYANGYTPAQLDTLVRSQDWMSLIMDKENRNDVNIARRQRKDRYMLSVEFEKSPFENINGGFLKANNVGYLLSELTADRLDPMKYSDLNRDFACVAVDLVSGKEVVMHEGILAESMRTSMAIPGVFTPIRRDSMVLVDGGLLNNYPVDVARNMGAEIVIGVNVGSPDVTYDKLNGTIPVLMQVMGVICANKLEENIANTDIYMQVDVNGYSSASFTSDAVDSLLVRGERAARSKWDDLVLLRKSLEQFGPLPEIPKKDKVLDIDYETFRPVPSICSYYNKSSFVGVGARFDSEELASILLGGEYDFNSKNHFKVGLETRLAKCLNVDAYTSISPGEKWSIELRYRFSHADFPIYDEGDHITDMVYNKNRVRLDFSRAWKHFRLNFGGQFTYTNFRNLLVRVPDEDEDAPWHDISNFSHTNERAIYYYASFQFDNQDARYLARKGMKWLVKYNYCTDNGYGFNDKGGVSIVEGYWRMAVPLSSSTILNPSVEGRFIQNNNTYLSNYNFIGGINSYGHYITQQLSFAGISYVQIVPNSLLIGGLNLRQHFTSNNYAFLQMNYAFTGNSINFNSFLRKQNLFGAALGYGYNSPIGPIELNFNWSNVTKKVGCYLNIGYMF